MAFPPVGSVDPSEGLSASPRAFLNRIGKRRYLGCSNEADCLGRVAEWQSGRVAEW
jgi:hypothetical protein